MLITFAHHQGRKLTQILSRAEQKQFGQFMTPPSIARFMALRMVASVDLHHVRVLDPAAGAGILAAAVDEALLAKSVRPQRVELSMFELDARLLPALRQLAARMAEACRAQGVEFDCSIANADFLLSDLALSGQPVDGLLTIANPPFFKLNKASDIRAQAHAYAVHGQPNIYSLFMPALRKAHAGQREVVLHHAALMDGRRLLQGGASCAAAPSEFGQPAFPSTAARRASRKTPCCRKP